MRANNDHYLCAFCCSVIIGQWTHLRIILAIANHHTVETLIQRLRAQHVRFKYRALLVPGRAQHSLEEHQTILIALMTHDEAAAENAMRNHLASAVSALRQSNKSNNLAVHSWI